MLRCAGCGEPVSEWAARCPACRHSTDDAIDEEEPGPAHRRRSATVPALAVAAAMVLGATAVGIGVTSGSGGRTDRALLPAPPSLGGHILARSPGSAPFEARPDGRGRRMLPVGPLRRGDTPLFVSGGGLLVAARPGGGSPFLDAHRLTWPAGTTRAGAEPFTDGGRAVLIRSGAAGRELSAWPVPAGPPVPLGGGVDSAAGDPASIGAFVAVSGPGPTDSRLELRDRGHPALVLATVAQLNRDSGRPAGQPVHLTMFPDADGQKVAVVLNPPGGGGSDSPLVVLDRRGRVLSAVGSGTGPISYSTPYWSPDGASLAYATFDSSGTALAVLSGGRVASQGFEPSTSVDGCAWSPDSAWVLCLANTSFASNWVLARNTDTLAPIYSFPLPLVPATGSRAPSRYVPLDWLP